MACVRYGNGAAGMTRSLIADIGREGVHHDELKEPTVEDLINHLSQFHPKLPVRINDQDTDWTISNINIGMCDNGKVWLYGTLGDMTRES